MIDSEIVTQVERLLKKVAIKFKKPEHISATNITSFAKLIDSYISMTKNIESDSDGNDYYSRIERGEGAPIPERYNNDNDN